MSYGWCFGLAVDGQAMKVAVSYSLCGLQEGGPCDGQNTALI